MVALLSQPVMLDRWGIIKGRQQTTTEQHLCFIWLICFLFPPAFSWKRCVLSWSYAYIIYMHKMEWILKNQNKEANFSLNWMLTHIQLYWAFNYSHFSETLKVRNTCESLDSWEQTQRSVCMNQWQFPHTQWIALFSADFPSRTWSHAILNRFPQPLGAAGS